MSDAPHSPGYTHATPTVTDWAQMVAFTPGSYYTPRTLDEVGQILIAVAARPGARVRVLGGLHSCAEIVSADVVIDTSRLPLQFGLTQSPGASAASVTASAYMHTREFLSRSAQEGLSLTALGGTDAQTLAGLISTNTAGATAHHSIYETVDWIEFLRLAPDGRSVVFEKIHKGDSNFAGAICSLGAIGFMTQVGFTLPQQRFFTGVFQMASLQAVLGNLDATCSAHEFWRIEWLPKNSLTGLMWTATRLTTPTDPDGDYPLDGTQSLLKLIMQMSEEILNTGPFLNPSLEVAYTLLASTYVPVIANGPMRNILPCDRRTPLHVAMAEWSFAPADLQRVMSLCRAYFNANGWPNLPIEIECTRTDAFWMSPWNWQGLGYIVKLNFQYLTDFLSDGEKGEVVTHLHGLWNALLAAGIPFKAHWGKINFLTPELVARLYQLDRFAPLVQPVFINDYLDQRLGLYGP